MICLPSQSNFDRISFSHPAENSPTWGQRSPSCVALRPPNTPKSVTFSTVQCCRRDGDLACEMPPHGSSQTNPSPNCFRMTIVRHFPMPTSRRHPGCPDLRCCHSDTCHSRPSRRPNCCRCCRCDYRIVAFDF